jgi:GAF domain-containing protein
MAGSRGWGSELSEALEQQTATANVLKVISRSAFDLKAVLNTLVESAARLCEADTVSIGRPKGGIYDFEASYGLTPESAEFLANHPTPIDRSTISGRVLLEHKIVHVSDVLADPEYTYWGGQNLRRTFLGVPLLREGAPIGVIALGRFSVRPFTDRQIELVQNFADQAVIAIENTRLLSELRQRTTDLSESLEQQTATSEVLRVISSSPGELEPVFEAMLENATRLCGARFGALNLYDGESFQNVALHNVPPGLADIRLREPFRPHPDSAMAHVARTKEIAHIHDLRTQPPYLARDPAVVAMVDLAGARTILVVPMLKEDRLVGTISIFRQEVRPFADKQIELVNNFAKQAVIAIENVRLLNELRARTTELARSVEELRALGAVSQAVNSTLDLQTVLDTIVAKATQISGTEAGAIYVLDERQREFQLSATFGMSEDLIAAVRNMHAEISEAVDMLTGTHEPSQQADLRDLP